MFINIIIIIIIFFFLEIANLYYGMAQITVSWPCFYTIT